MPTCSNWRGKCWRRWPRRSATRSWRAPRAASTGWADYVGPHRAPRARPTPRRTPRERSSRRTRGPGCAARARRRSRRARRSSGPSQSPLPDVTIVLTGGVRTPSDSLVGPVAVTALRSLHVDVLFTGVHGMAGDAGFTTPNLLEAETNRALIECAERMVVLADHTNWGVRGLSRLRAPRGGAHADHRQWLAAGGQDRARRAHRARRDRAEARAATPVPASDRRRAVAAKGYGAAITRDPAL